MIFCPELVEKILAGETETTRIFEPGQTVRTGAGLRRSWRSLAKPWGHTMPRRSTVCAHPKVEAIDMALVAGEPPARRSLRSGQSDDTWRDTRCSAEEFEEYGCRFGVRLWRGRQWSGRTALSVLWPPRCSRSSRKLSCGGSAVTARPARCSWQSRLSSLPPPYDPRGVHTYWLNARA